MAGDGTGAGSDRRTLQRRLHGRADRKVLRVDEPAIWRYLPAVADLGRDSPVRPLRPGRTRCFDDQHLGAFGKLDIQPPGEPAHHRTRSSPAAARLGEPPASRRAGSTPTPRPGRRHCGRSFRRPAWSPPRGIGAEIDRPSEAITAGQPACRVDQHRFQRVAAPTRGSRILAAPSWKSRRSRVRPSRERHANRPLASTRCGARAASRSLWGSAHGPAHFQGKSSCLSAISLVASAGFQFL